MKTYKCEEMMCNGCVSRIDKALTEAEIKHTVSLEDKIGRASCRERV